MADTISLMKQRVLDMAIRGELVEQREVEGSGKELLSEIKEEKERLIKEKQMKKEKDLEQIKDEDLIFKIPLNWEWTKLGELTASKDNSFSDGPFGSNLKTIHYTDNPEVRIIQLNNVGEGEWKDAGHKYTTYEHADTLVRCNVNPGDIVIAKMMPAGRAIIVPNIEVRYILSSDNVKFVPNEKINATYIKHAINSSVLRSYIASNATGTTRVRTSSAKLKNLLIPLPPISEQKRIVGKIESLFVIIDQISERKKDSLKIIENIRKTALQTAIMGQLVEQDENDESASELVKNIHEEKEQLIKENKIKKEKALSTIDEEEIPFDIPERWEWVRLKDISIYIKAGGDKPKEFSPLQTEIHNIPVIANGIKNDGIVGYTNEATITDTCITVSGRGTIGFSCVRTEPFTPIVRLLVLKVSNKISQDYIKYVLTTLLEKGVGTSIKQLTVPMLKPKLFPLPPLAEQKRIVEKLNQIMAICDQMEEILDGSREEMPMEETIA